jgi:hypothetical protein
VWDGPTGAAWGAHEEIPKRWVEYDFNRSQHTVRQYDIGSTYAAAIDSHSDSTYVLSPLENGSATSVHYASVQCYPPEISKKLSHDKVDAEKRWRLGGDLEVAQQEAGIVAEQRLEAPPSATLSLARPSIQNSVYRS